ncbi:hypothetical protein GC194_03545 [bacterium]|nr:hypothetical protein [bacterium]
MKNHPHRAQWFKNGKAIINDNLNNWSIEDAGMYNMIWLYSLCGYANYLQHEEIFENPVLNYYFEYNKQLYSPAGVIPDYGDAWWKSWWHLTMPVFEVGAKAANSKSLRWVAQDAMFKNLDTTKHNIDIALKLSEAYLWAGEQSQAEMPQNQSKQVLDDAIGKKIVFRSGWQPEDTYLLLNYRDETESGWLFKQNLYNTLSIEHEKIHHGHSDENSIVCWMYKGSLLLHDGGYRPALPSGPNGAYRADIFHNKPVLRKGLLPLQNGVIEQFKNDGYHEKVTTFKIDFITGKYADYSRTRTVDTALHIISDRTIVYCKSIAAFVVTDIVISTKNKNDVSAAVLWHTQTIKELGNNWFVGRYDSIGHWKSSSEITMFACFPNEKQVMQSENIDRHKQNEKVVSISRSQQLQQGESLVFHSVLIPVGEANYAQLAGDIMRVASSENAAAVSIKYAGKTLQIVHKIDLEADIARQWPRPRYQYQSGEIVGEKLRSDGHFLFLQKSDSVYVQALNCTAVYYNETCIFEQSKVTNEYRPDGAAPTADAWKVRMFEKTIGKQ